MVIRLQIVEIGKGAVALHQAKAFGVAVSERADLQSFGVGQWAPDHLTRTVLDQQTVCVMHGGAEIVEAIPVGLVIQKHRRQGCNPHMAQGLPGKQACGHIHHQRFAVANDKRICARTTWAVQ